MNTPPFSERLSERRHYMDTSACRFLDPPTRFVSLGGLIRMRITVLITFVALLSLSLFGCKKSAATRERVTPPRANNGRVLEACSLITKEEVGFIQGATILDTKSSESRDGAYVVSLCYYSSREPNLSVSVALTQASSDGSVKSNPRDYWKQTFEDAKEQADPKPVPGKTGEREQERESAPPRKIEGIGEDAYWLGNAVGGAFYVLQKDLIVRVSVGGPSDEEAKISKSKMIAQKILSRL